MSNHATTLTDLDGVLYSTLERAMAAQLGQRGPHLYTDHAVIKAETQQFLPSIVEGYGLQWVSTQLQLEETLYDCLEEEESARRGDLVITYAPAGELRAVCDQHGAALTFKVLFTANAHTNGVLTIRAFEGLPIQAYDFWVEGDAAALSSPAFLDAVDKWHTWQVLSGSTV